MPRFAIVLVLAFGFLAPHATWAEGPIRTYTLSGWTITEYEKNCIAHAKPMTFGSTLFFFKLRPQGFAAAVANKKWRMTKGRRSTVTMEIDGKTYGKLPTMAFQADMLDIELPVEIGSALQEGDVVKLKFERATYFFKLNNSRKGLAALEDCYLSKSNATDGASVAAPPNQQLRERPPVATSGSGFFVSGDGHILTNNHVVNSCVVPSVIGYGDAVVIKRDPTNDLALLKVAGNPGFQAALRSTDVALAQKILAFGYPLSQQLGGSLNVTTGLISGMTGPGGDSRFVQISAAVQPGNSGGPLVDTSGNVVGMITKKMGAISLAGKSATLTENVAWAIRSDFIRPFLRLNGVNEDPPHR